MTEPTLVVRVVQALAAAEGKDTDEIDFNLANHIDPEVLTSLEGMDDGQWSFTFRVSDHQVTVTDESKVFVDGQSDTIDKKKSSLAGASDDTRRRRPSRGSAP